MAPEGKGGAVRVGGELQTESRLTADWAGSFPLHLPLNFILCVAQNQGSHLAMQIGQC